MTACVTHVSMSPDYAFTKPSVAQIRLLAGLGGEGDIHSGVTGLPLLAHRPLERV